MVSTLAVLSIALVSVVADECGLQGEIAALRPKDVSAQEAAVLDNLEQRAQRALAAIPRAGNRQEADQARPGLRRRLLHSLGIPRLPWPPELRPRLSVVLKKGKE